MERHFRELKFPVKEIALLITSISTKEKTAKVFESVDIELATAQFERALLNRPSGDFLKLGWAFPWLDLVGMDVEQLDECFVFLLWKVVAEVARGPEIGQCAERQQ